jgi:hypothetical protein
MKAPSLDNPIVGTAGSEELPIKGTGTVKLKGQNFPSFKLLDTLCVPGLRHNLITAGALQKQGANIKLDPTNPNCFEVVIGNEIFLRGRFERFLMIVRIEPVSNISQDYVNKNEANSTDSVLLHNRLGHLNETYLQKTTGHKSNHAKSCDKCRITKSTRLPFTGTRPKGSLPLDNIHIDLSGIIRIPCIYGYSYFMLVIDQSTQMIFIYFLKSKTQEEVFEAINLFITRAERHWDCKVKMFTSDGGSELINSLLTGYCHELGIIKNTSVPYSPQQNSIVERAVNHSHEGKVFNGSQWNTESFLESSMPNGRFYSKSNIQ